MRIFRDADGRAQFHQALIEGAGTCPRYEQCCKPSQLFDVLWVEQAVQDAARVAVDSRVGLLESNAH
jgi:hypothetical protein